MLQQRSARTAVPASTPHRRTQLALVVPAAALAAVSLAGCGGGSGATARSASAPASTVRAAGTNGSAANRFAAYSACLSKNGVTLPSGRPGGFSRPSGAARPTGRPSRGAGGGFGGGFGLNTADPKTAAALKACAAERPTGGFGGFGGNNAALQSQLTAYRSCLSDHGVTLPTPAARVSASPRAAGRPGGSGGFGGLGALNTADPKTAAAVTACEALRPTFAPRGAAPAPTVTPST